MLKIWDTKILEWVQFLHGQKNRGISCICKLYFSILLLNCKFFAGRCFCLLHKGTEVFVNCISQLYFSTMRFLHGWFLHKGMEASSAREEGNSSTSRLSPRGWRSDRARCYQPKTWCNYCHDVDDDEEEDDDDGDEVDDYDESQTAPHLVLTTKNCRLNKVKLLTEDLYLVW